MLILSNEVKQLAAKLGADLCGIAPIARFADAPKGFHPCDVQAECKSVIVIAAVWPDCSSRQGSDIYTMARNLMANKMDLMATALASELQIMGALSAPISSMGDCRWDDQGRSRGPISLKHAAELAGLGRIGRNTLLVNEQYGNMIWLSAVLVTEELQADPIATYEVCSAQCRACEASCPAGAINGDTLFNQLACHRTAYSYHGGKELIECHQCRTICPHCRGIQKTTSRPD